MYIYPTIVSESALQKVYAQEIREKFLKSILILL